jgi:hypothetical protein
MKKLFSILGFILLAILALSCVEPFEVPDGKFSISFGGGNSSARSLYEDREQLTFTIKLSNGPGADQSVKDIKYGQTVNFSVVPGRWDIYVAAWLEGELKADHSRTVVIKPGRNDPIKITLDENGNIICDHQWGEWEIETPATCMATGLKKRTCLLDPTHHDEPQVIPIDPNAHDLGNSANTIEAATCEAPGKEKGNCSICDKTDVEKIIAALGHDYKLVTTKIPTFTKTGEEKQICNRDQLQSHIGEIRTLGTVPYFASVAELGEYLETYNSPTSVTKPYYVNLRVNDESELDGIKDALGGATGDKYVYLDLTGSTIETIPANTFYGSATPYGTAALVGVTIPDGVITIGDYAFCGCSNLPRVIIPNSVKSIEYCAFYDCSNLRLVIFEEGSDIQSFGDGAFLSGTTWNPLSSLYNSSKAGAYSLEIYYNGDPGGWSFWGRKGTITLPAANVTTLTEGVWADGNLPVNGEKLYKFTATTTATTTEWQCIHLYFGTLTRASVAFYDSDGFLLEQESTRYLSSGVVSPSVTSGQTYYIRVTPYSSGDSGTYKIAFNQSYETPPAITLPTANVTTLTEGAWVDGNLPQYGEKWYKFTATADSQYIHFGVGTLISVFVQTYNSNGTVLGNMTRLYGSTTYTNRTVTTGQTYYIRVMPYSNNNTTSLSGTYKIAFNQSTTAPAMTPAANVTALSEGEWASGSLPANGEQWFKFTATASTQYIHVYFGTLTDVFVVSVYDSSNTQVGSGTVFYSSTVTTRTVTPGDTYYIRVNSNSGTYKIAFFKTIIPIDTPASLTLNTWEDGNIPQSSGEQWFSFTATVSGTQYIHASWGTLSSLYVYIYNPDGTVLGGTLILDGNTTRASWTVTLGQTYYIRVRPYSYWGGTYKIAVNAATTAPAIPLPIANVTTLTEGEWAAGSLPANEYYQWFKFTATIIGTQYIHASFVTLSGMYVDVYNSDGTALGTQAILSYPPTVGYTNRTVTSGVTYYIRVSQISNLTGTYKIAFNASTTAPAQ